jgi:hypothetical protein
MAISNLPLHEQNVENIEQKILESLGPTLDEPSILDKQGRILYSSHETLTKGKYYFLGLNPGGGADTNNPTIRESLDDLRSYTGNAYFAEDDRADWSNPKRHYAKGEHPYQKAFRTLFEEFGENPRDVCASNLIFKRSADARHSEYPKLAKKCWPVHESILEIVQPEVIIAFGKDAFDFVRLKLNGGPVQNDGIKDNPGFWGWKDSKIKSPWLKGNMPLICVRHPSRYPLKKSVAGEIRDFLVQSSVVMPEHPASTIHEIA